ncbi:MAG: DMT family transporter [Gammaproteobacteria bacterium]|nr:DMT family transporter [Gammaproteobacteria bacterium]MYD76684.1 DMT family transporter [Gammaproteobacteria bacterium]MYJ53139.1 DMT family transporter [Gammaproteobacteria bacterium]
MPARPIRPEIVVALAAASWGLFWIPIRVLESHGLEPALVTISQFIAPVVFLAPFGLIRMARGKSIGLEQYDSGLLIGAAFALYCESLLLTDVVRSLILFYVMPAWATLIELCVLKRRFTLWRGLALVLSLGGMVAILNIDASFRLSFNLGDAMALVSGLCFAFGATRVRQSPEIDVFAQVFAFFFYGAIVSVLLLLIPVTAPSGMPGADLVWRLLPWVVLMTVVYLIPIMWSLYWGSRLVDPGRLGILLQLEVIVGIGSAALLTGEPFGIREAVGTALVISAGLIEVISNNPTARD